MMQAPMQYDPALTAFGRSWLEGSTCHRHPHSIHWFSDDLRFVLMKHNGHSDYVDRMCGTQRCGTYYALYDLTKPRPGALGGPYLLKVEGRWTKAHWCELVELVAKVTKGESNTTVAGSPVRGEREA
jgi:hypothetical protein